MQIRSVTLQNFRRCKDPITVDFGDLTAFVGKNDVGKSTILEALDIFFNEKSGIVKLDKSDINKDAYAAGDKDIVITARFDHLPETVVLDTANETSLSEEYLLNEAGQLEITKKYPNAGSPKIYIKAIHPTNPQCANLILLKDAELRRIIDEQNIECADKSRNAIMRKAIRNHFKNDLRLSSAEIEVTKSSVWDNLQNRLPLYSLFQADRKNTDSDCEVQDPLRSAVKEILADEDLAQKLQEVAETVQQKLREVADRTLEKLREMSPDIAQSLNPVIPESSSLKWADVFKGVSIAGDGNIPVNKRGSGVKRLILFNFFRAEAEHRLQERNAASIIYAIEEPETAQHADNQKKLVRALLSLSQSENTQIIMTTHSATVVKELGFDNLRLICDHAGTETILPIEPRQLPYPSLNEVNHIAFSEATEEYHNELYGFIEAQGCLNEFRADWPTMTYIKVQNDGRQQSLQVDLSTYIRHQIHHPENVANRHHTEDELHESIKRMRKFIVTRFRKQQFPESVSENN